LTSVLDTTPPRSTSPRLGWRSTTPILRCGLMAALAVLSSPAFAQDVMRYHVKHITLLAEDGQVRVLRYAAHRGDKTPMHSHPLSVVYVVKGGRLKITLPDGTSTISTLKSGTALIRPPVVHADEALEDVELILTEFKSKAHMRK
jgi:quercetin dioxygenase-like cupin family protein